MTQLERQLVAEVLRLRLQEVQDRSLEHRLTGRTLEAETTAAYAAQLQQLIDRLSPEPDKSY